MEKYRLELSSFIVAFCKEIKWRVWCLYYCPLLPSVITAVKLLHYSESLTCFFAAFKFIQYYNSSLESSTPFSKFISYTLAIPGLLCTVFVNRHSWVRIKLAFISFPPRSFPSLYLRSCCNFAYHPCLWLSELANIILFSGMLSPSRRFVNDLGGYDSNMSMHSGPTVFTPFYSSILRLQDLPHC